MMDAESEIALIASASDALHEHERLHARRTNSQLDRLITNAIAPYRFGIITALPKEAAAVEAVFGGSSPLPSISRSAMSFRSLRCLAADGGEHHVVLGQALRMGNNSASVAAASMLGQFQNITDILIVGIAGGVPNISAARTGDRCDDHVRKGDVVVSDSILQYDMLKLEEDRDENRSRPMPASARLLGAMQDLERDAERDVHDWEKYIAAAGLGPDWTRPGSDLLHDFEFGDGADLKVLEHKLTHPKQEGRRAKTPLVHRATIGSANILLKNSRVRDSLRDRYKVRAIEMEGSGVADASWSFNVGYLAVRGICDYCDRKKDNRWQHYAALVAAAFSRGLLERVPTE
jgi:nucleoside phosphorylase